MCYNKIIHDLIDEKIYLTLKAERLEGRVTLLNNALTTIISAHERYCEAMGARGWKPDSDPLFEACEAARAVLQPRA